MPGVRCEYDNDNCNSAWLDKLAVNWLEEEMSKLGDVKLACTACSQEEILLLARVRSPTLSTVTTAPITDAIPLQ